MKRVFASFFSTVLVIAGFSMAVTTQSLAQDSGPLMLSKNFNGSVTRSSVEIGLTANADCDQTKNFIPDNSRLIAQSFSLNADSNGVGTFSGSAYVITPAGRVVLQGTLKGTVGINTRCGSSRSCRLPWHLEGLFESTLSSVERVALRTASDIRIAPTVLNFSGDLNPQATSALPIYQGRLDGLVPTLPAEIDRIMVVQDKAIYAFGDIMNATVVNESSETIQATDKRSFCSIFQLQILDGNQWNDTALCPFKEPSLPVDIPPNTKFGVQLNLSQAMEPLKEGAYRLALTFKFVSNNAPLSDSFVRQSPQFRLVPQASSNQVSVNTDRAAYSQEEPIAFRVNNDTSQTVVTSDHQSFCSIVTVQKQEGGNWEEVFPCLLSSMTKLVKIASSEEIEAKLPTASVSSKLPPGTYRLEFTYWNADANGAPTGEPTIIHSATFSVAGK